MSKWSGKWMDEKGRLFGKINIIDFAVILFLLFILPMFYFGYKIYSTTGGDVSEDTGEKAHYDTTIECLMIGIPPETAKKVATGDVERDETGKIVGKIVEVFPATPYLKSFSMDSATKLLLEDKNLKQIPVRLQLTVFLQNDRAYYRGKTNLLVNYAPIKFKTDQYETTCMVKDSGHMKELIQAGFAYEESMKPKKSEESAKRQKSEKSMWATIRASFVDIPEVLDVVKEGDLNRENSGVILGEILRIISRKPFEILNLKDDQFVKITHPYKQELVADLRILCEAYVPSLDFCGRGNETLRVNMPILFASSRYLIKGNVLKIDRIE